MAEDDDGLTHKKAIVLPLALLADVDDYRRKLSPIPSQSEAIRQLIRLGLEAASAPQKEPRR